MIKNELITGTIGTSLSAVGTATQTNEVLQTISLIITIIGGIITFILMPMLAWFKEAKKDDYISKEEVQEALDILKNGSKKVQDELDKRKDN